MARKAIDAMIARSMSDRQFYWYCPQRGCDSCHYVSQSKLSNDERFFYSCRECQSTYEVIRILNESEGTARIIIET